MALWDKGRADHDDSTDLQRHPAEQGILMNTDRRLAETRTDVLITPMSHGEWRVSDGRVPWDSPFCLIGFISLNSGTYEVLEFADPVRTYFVGSMTEAEEIFAPPARDPVTRHPIRALHRVENHVDGANSGRRP